MQHATLTIVNRLGLHARAASKLVNLAKRFQCDIRLSHGDAQADAKSIMGVMLLAAPLGSVLEVTTTGTDEVAALQAVRELIEDRFGEPE